MKIWHKDLIKVLPRTQLIRLLKDCIHIIQLKMQYGDITAADVRGAYPYSALRVNEYDVDNVLAYTKLVCEEIQKRLYTVSDKTKQELEHIYIIYSLLHTNVNELPYLNVQYKDIFKGWHNKRYLKQCYYILEEMYDCGVYSEGDINKAREIVMAVKTNVR